ncbi:SIR2 family NAD-dependent protein deacylase [Pseudomonas bohemica]|uniref:SIR2 family NAD-dependent protein deacylase n=1 Tax=Pseudomonas bohemica TaxID=2044872 RepID=UPI000DA5EE95|nr:NAD-dependent protein deacylase [Pseudomonas bohemica]
MATLGQAREALRNAKTIVCFSGAGISAESGIPTYRDGMTGLWAGQSAQQMETAKAFRQNPQLIWGWYLWRRQHVARAQPNAAHRSLSQLIRRERPIPIITQNIDDLHERAGSVDVVHLHGCLSSSKCFACHRPARVTPVPIQEEGALVEPPRCVHCNGRLRPGHVWYGEELPAGTWKSAVSLVKNCDVLLSIGTSGVVTPAASLPGIALSAGATVIHVNTADVSLDAANELMLIGKATEILTQLCSPLVIAGRAQ